MTRLQANTLLLFVAAIWGAGFVAQSTAMQSVGPYWFMTLRFFVASIVAFGLAMMEQRKADKPVSRRNIVSFGIIGFALFGGATFQQVGLMTTSVTNSGFLTALYVVFVPILSLLVLRKVPHWIIWPAALLALAGIFLLSGGNLTALSRGDFLTIICAGFWAIQVLLVGIFVGDSGRPYLLSFVQFFTCTLLSLIGALIMEPFSWTQIAGAGWEILYVGLFSTGLGFTFQVVGQRYTTAPQAAIILSSESLFGALFGLIFMGDRIGLIGYAGCALIFIALLLVELLPGMTETPAKPAGPAPQDL